MVVLASNWMGKKVRSCHSVSFDQSWRGFVFRFHWVLLNSWLHLLNLLLVLWPWMIFGGNNSFSSTATSNFPTWMMSALRNLCVTAASTVNTSFPQPISHSSAYILGREKHCLSSLHQAALLSWSSAAMSHTAVFVVVVAVVPHQLSIDCSAIPPVKILEKLTNRPKFGLWAPSRQKCKKRVQHLPSRRELWCPHQHPTVFWQTQLSIGWQARRHLHVTRRKNSCKCPFFIPQDWMQGWQVCWIQWTEKHFQRCQTFHNIPFTSWRTRDTQAADSCHDRCIQQCDNVCATITWPPEHRHWRIQVRTLSSSGGDQASCK